MQQQMGWMKQQRFHVIASWPLSNHAISPCIGDDGRSKNDLTANTETATAFCSITKIHVFSQGAQRKY
jgi:hypothetical protein